jgi:hypothetical protein
LAADHLLDVVEGFDPPQRGLDDRGVATLGDLVEPGGRGPAKDERHWASGTLGIRHTWQAA